MATNGDISVPEPLCTVTRGQCPNPLQFRRGRAWQQGARGSSTPTSK